MLDTGFRSAPKCILLIVIWGWRDAKVETETAGQRVRVKNEGIPNTDGMANAIELFRERARQSPHQVAVRWKEGGTWRTETFGDWDRASREIGAGLASLGVVAGDRVGLIANSRREWLYADIGIIFAGAITVPIYPSNLPDECQYVLTDSGAKVVIAENGEQLAKLVAEREKLPRVAKVICIDPAPSASDWVMSLSELREAGRTWLGGDAAEIEKRWSEITRASTYTIVYTSGTTGPPKGVVLTHANVLWECDAMKDVLEVNEKDEQLLFLPLAHIFARIIEWVVIATASKCAFAESIPKVKENLAEVRPTFMCSVPRVLEKVYLAILGNRNAAPPVRQKIFDWAFSVGKQVSAYRQRGQAVPFVLSIKNAIATKLVFAKIQAVLGGRMRFIISGGAPLSREIAEFFHAAGVLILEGWGLTETFAGSTLNRVEKYSFGTVGQPVGSTELRIAADGEILVRSGGVMKEYFGKPEATAEAIDADGWFHTGDIGVIDDGMLKITDRKKDIIVNAGGKNIAPQNLENALKSTPYISQVMVHGDKRPYLVALITLNEENSAKWAESAGLGGRSIAELSMSDQVRALVQKYVDELNAKLPSYSQLKKFAVLPKDFSQETGELTPTLKVKRKFATEKFKDLIDGFYAN